MKKNFKLLKILLGKKKWKYFWILILATFFAMALECVGISLVFPVVSVLLNPVDGAGQKVSVILLLIGLSYFLKNIYLIIVSYFRNKFILDCQFDLKKRLLFGFFYAPYMKYIDRSTDELVQAVETDVDGCIILMEKLMKIGGEIIMVALLCVIMMAVNFKVTVAVMLMCGFLMLLFIYLIKPYSEKKSKQYAKARKEFHKWLHQSVRNMKEIKAEQKEYFFMKNFNQYSEKACHIDSKVRFVQGLPMAAFEMCFVLSLLVVLFLLLKNSNDTTQVIAELSVLGIIVIRMMPSALKLNQLLGSIFWHIPMLERTGERLKEQEIWQERTENVKPLNFNQEVKLKEISFSYPQTGTKIFDKASMEIFHGKLTGISGLSGAGKTTLVDIIIGLLPVSEGRIWVDGLPLDNCEEYWASWQTGVAYIPQNACLLNATIRENILFGSEDRGDAAIWDVLKLAAADEFVRQLPLGLETLVGENGSMLSGGQGQRLALARALYKKAQLLILDETTSALDAKTENIILDAIRKICSFSTVILISHKEKTLEVCDYIYEIKEGKIIPVKGV